MIHYVCSGGCLTVQYQTGLCPVPGCYRYRNPLSQCDCTDGRHGDWLFRNHPEPTKARAAARYRLTKLANLVIFVNQTTPKSQSSPAKAKSKAKKPTKKKRS